jgi:hypothetical protein
MFDSLEEPIKGNEARTTTPTQRIVHWAFYGLLAALLFGWLFLALYVMS